MFLRQTRLSVGHLHVAAVDRSAMTVRAATAIIVWLTKPSATFDLGDCMCGNYPL